MTSEGEPTYDARISARVREVRLLRGLKQSEIAHRIGIDQGTYARYENNQRARGWPVWMLADVADALVVPLVTLVPGERVVCEACGSSKGELVRLLPE